MGENRLFAVYVSGLESAVEDFVRRVTAEGVPPQMAHQLVGAVPCPVKRNLRLDSAQRYQAMFRRAGATVDLIPEPFAPPSARTMAGHMAPERPPEPPPELDARGSFVIAVPVPGGSGLVELPPPVELDALAIDGPDEFAAATPVPGPSVVVGLLERPSVVLPPAPRLVTHGPIRERLAAVPRYVIRPQTLAVLVGAALVGYLGSFAIGAFLPIIGVLLAPLFALAVQATIFFRIIEQTSHGEEHLDPPDFVEPFGDLLAPALRYIAVLLPALVGFAYLGMGALLEMAQGRPPWRALLAEPAMALLVLGGIGLVPLLAAIAALSKSVIDTYNPVHWVTSLRMMGAEYPLAAVCFYALYVSEAFATVLLSGLAVTKVPILGSISITFLAYLFLAARARVLGALVQPYIPR